MIKSPLQLSLTPGLRALGNDRVEYFADGATKSFFFPDAVPNPGNFLVILSELATQLIHPSVLNGRGTYDFTVTGTLDSELGEYPSGATITFNTAPPLGWSVAVGRLLPLTQPVALTQDAKFPVAAVNAEFDRLTMCDQQAQEQLNWAVQHRTQGGNWDAAGLGISNLGTPVLAGDAATKAYVDGVLGATGWPPTTLQFPDGVLIDALGTGTADDTAIWTTAIARAQTLGLYRIYARRPSNVKNLNINGPLEILGVHGQFQLNLAATGTANDTVLNILSGPVKLQGFKIVMPRYVGITHNASVPGFAGIYAGNPGAQAVPAQSLPVSRLWLEDLTVIGGGYGMLLIGCDRLDILNCETSYNSNFGIVTGGEGPATKLRIDGLRGVACGLELWLPSNIDAPAAFSYGCNDIEITGAYAINCGKFGLYGVQGGQKTGFDLSINAMQRVKFKGVAVGCGVGGVEIKYTTFPPQAGVERLLQDQDVTILNYQDTDTGYGFVVDYAPVAIPAGYLKRLRVRGGSTFVGPRSWVAGLAFEIGDTVANGANLYICWGDANGLPGTAGATGPPTGTATGLSSFFDGKLYWEYWGAAPTSPATFHCGMQIFASGDSNHGITVENFEAQDCGYAALLFPGQSADETLWQLRLLNLSARNCVNGIFCNQQTDNANPGVIKSLHIIDADIDVLNGTALQLGAAAGGGSGRCDLADLLISGGKFSARGTTGYPVYFAGGQIDGRIEGGSYFVSALAGAVITDTTTVLNLVLDAATFENLGPGFIVCHLSGPGGTWQNRGRVQMIQPDNSQQAWLADNATPTAFYGQVIRNLLAAAPTSAGNLNERVEVSSPVTAATGRWDCTTAGGAGAAVWTAKP